MDHPPHAAHPAAHPAAHVTVHAASHSGAHGSTHPTAHPVAVVHVAAGGQVTSEIKHEAGKAGASGHKDQRLIMSG